MYTSGFHSNHTSLTNHKNLHSSGTVDQSTFSNTSVNELCGIFTVRIKCASQIREVFAVYPQVLLKLNVRVTKIQVRVLVIN